MDTEVELMLIERRIERVLVRYTRAVDRFDMAAVRSCYWPGAQDRHGAFSGSVEAYIPWVDHRLRDFERTMHYLTNVQIEVSDSREAARVESYLLAYHRSERAVDGPVEMFLGLRYVDRFECRAGEWRIAARVCAYEWKREMVAGETGFGPSHVVGARGPEDALTWIMDGADADHDGRGPR